MSVSTSVNPTSSNENARAKLAAPTDLAGPAWNNHSEYPSLASNEFAHDLEHFENLHKQIETMVAKLKEPLSTTSADDEVIGALQSLYELEDQAWTLIGNLSTYVHCESCMDGGNLEAQRLTALIAQKRAALAATLTPVALFLDKADASVIERYLSHPHTAAQSFSLHRSRELADTRLSEGEESALTRMRTHAIDSFARLYDQISGNLRCRVENADGTETEMGLSQAASLLRDTSEQRRKAAWNAIQNSWKTHEQSGAAILNGLAGWRIEEARLRSHTRKIGFLDSPVHVSAIRRETLDAMMESIWQMHGVGQQANRAMARALRKPALDPWDLLAGAPDFAGEVEARIPFKDGLRMIREAFASVAPELADFVDMMEKNRWIEGRAQASKRQGAFCTRFPKSRTPRVYQTYMGSINDIKTLAHELGHAYHGWIMRDLPRAAHRYPMTLAETASIFAETVLADHVAGCGDRTMKFAIAWQDAAAASAHLLNIPARFEFEKNFYERRETAAQCSASELGDMTESAWKKWYGDTISQAERQFWMTKLHFSISGVSFYNFPYSFGALFSLSIYARRNEFGSSFLAKYNDILRDTGCMTAEDLARKHLGEDITRPEFWAKSLRVNAAHVDHFESLIRSIPMNQ